MGTEWDLKTCFLVKLVVDCFGGRSIMELGWWIAVFLYIPRGHVIWVLLFSRILLYYIIQFHFLFLLTVMTLHVVHVLIFLTSHFDTFLVNL